MVHFCKRAYSLHLGHAMSTSVSDILFLLLWCAHPSLGSWLVLTADRAVSGKGSWGSDRGGDWCRGRGVMYSNNNLSGLHSGSHYTCNLF